MLNIEDILNEESQLLDKVTENQQELRNAVNEKDWNNLMKVISSINMLMDKFNRLDLVRSKLSGEDGPTGAVYSALLSEVRAKLVKCRTENKALSEYISMTRNFIGSILDKTLPQSRNKLYSRNGNIVQSQPQSVVVNTLY